jgi:dTDP-4-dehydrorhamnose 3,5-epimerase
MAARGVWFVPAQAPARRSIACARANSCWQAERPGQAGAVREGRAICDVAVDARQGSPTFGHYVGAEISADSWMQIWVPAGFLHGYCTLTADTEVIYKVTAAYDKAAERGVIWNDPDIGIKWPVPADRVILSDKDQMLPRLRDLPH